MLNFYFNYKRNGEYCIIVTTSSFADADGYQMLKRLFDLYVINVNVFVMRGDNITIYAALPFSEKVCHSPDAYVLHELSNIKTLEDIRLNQPLFPNKAQNLHGCPLTVSVIPAPPFIYVKNESDTRAGRDQLPRLFGVEGEIFNILAEKLNFTMDLDLNTERGLIDDYGRAEGVLDMV